MSLQPTPLEWLLLRIIDEVPAWGNDYRLERFFAKTNVCLTIFEDVRGLVKKNLLSVKDPNAPVKEYNTTVESQQLLTEGYKTSSIKEYVMTIEPTGFILGLLEKMDANHSQSGGQ